MSKRGNLELLKDINEAANRIETFTHGMDYEGFLCDKKTQDAVVRNIEIIGEAVKNISSDFKEEHENIEWKRIAGMRDKIIHFYFGVNWDIVWDVIENKIPTLKAEITAIIEKGL